MSCRKLSVVLASLMMGGITAAPAAELLFLDGGYAEQCARAAEQVYQGRPLPQQAVTGTRLGFTAMEICSRAVNGYDGANENVAESYNNRGVLWFAQGDMEAALRDFERAVRERSTMAQAHVNQGYTLVALQRWSDAVAAFTRGIELGSAELPKAHYNRGIAHEETGALREAYADYRRAAELAPEWEDPQQELGRFQVLRSSP